MCLHQEVFSLFNCFVFSIFFLLGFSHNFGLCSLTSEVSLCVCFCSLLSCVSACVCPFPATFHSWFSGPPVQSQALRRQLWGPILQRWGNMHFWSLHCLVWACWRVGGSSGTLNSRLLLSASSGVVGLCCRPGYLTGHGSGPPSSHRSTFGPRYLTGVRLPAALCNSDPEAQQAVACNSVPEPSRQWLEICFSILLSLMNRDVCVGFSFQDTDYIAMNEPSKIQSSFFGWRKDV